VARITGDLYALTLACLLQVVGVALPLFSDSLVAAILSAVLFGATFVGIVSLVLTMAGRYFPSRPAKMMGRMTLSYGVAQILAPALIALMAAGGGGYSDGLWLATVAMLAGTLLMLVLKFLERAHTVPMTTTNEET